jgi:transcriptional regulator with XRE-family HTH domain
MQLYQEYIKDPKFKKLMAQEELIMEVTETLCELLNKENISRKELSDLLGKSKGFVSQLLNGGRNLTLRTIADIVGVLGYKITMNIQKEGDHKAKMKSSRIYHEELRFMDQVSSQEWQINKPFCADNYQVSEMAMAL